MGALLSRRPRQAFPVRCAPPPDAHFFLGISRRSLRGDRNYAVRYTIARMNAKPSRSAGERAVPSSSTVEIGVQINGKLRGTVAVDADDDNETAIAKAKAVEKIDAELAGRSIVKEIYVKGRIVNIVAK